MNYVRNVTVYLHAINNNLGFRYYLWKKNKFFERISLYMPHACIYACTQSNRASTV